MKTNKKLLLGIILLLSTSAVGCVPFGSSSEAGENPSSFDNSMTSSDASSSSNQSSSSSSKDIPIHTENEVEDYMNNLRKK